MAEPSPEVAGAGPKRSAPMRIVTLLLGAVAGFLPYWFADLHVRAEGGNLSVGVFYGPFILGLTALAFARVRWFGAGLVIGSLAFWVGLVIGVIDLMSWHGCRFSSEVRESSADPTATTAPVPDVSRRKTGVYFQPCSNPHGTTRGLPYRMFGRADERSDRRHGPDTGMRVPSDGDGLGL